jgi:hypothetical protein
MAQLLYSMGGERGERMYLVLMMPLVVGEVEVNPCPPVQMVKSNHILTKVRNKEWERMETVKLLKYYKQEFGQTRK